MRHSLTNLRMPAAVAALALALPLMTACPKHEDFPQPLAVQPVPVPSNLSITNPSGNDYDLAWEIDDPDNLVVSYRIYLVGGNGVADQLILETGSSQTSAGISAPFSLSGYELAVAAVSSENVEGYPATKRIPDQS